MKLESLHDLFVEQLKDTYDAEHQASKALTKMAQKASSEQLSESFKQHREVTKGQIKRLDEVFELLGVKDKRKECVGMAGLIAEGDEVMKEKAASEVMDAALIAVAQKVEHYEITAYGTLVAFAREMKHTREAELLEQTLNEEKQTDRQLTKLAESRVNPRAE